MTTGEQLPNGRQQFFDLDGNPLAAGFVYFYIGGQDPASTVFKNTYQDYSQTILNTNPVVLDAGGWATIWGDGLYRQVVTDALGNTIWDKTVLGYSAEADSDISYYDLSIFLSGVLTDAETCYIFNAPRNLELPAGLTASVGTVGVAPTATTTLTLAKNGVNIGTLAWDTSSVLTVTFTVAVDFAAGDQLTVTNQATADATAAFFAITLVFTVL